MWVRLAWVVQLTGSHRCCHAGFQAKELIIHAGLNLGDVDKFPSLDVTINGADEVNANLNAIKGGGACQLKEKVLAKAADTWMMFADYRTNSEVLGTSWTQGIPIDVAPFAYARVLFNLARLGSPTASDQAVVSGGNILTLRMGKAKAGTAISNNGTSIIDVPFSQELMKDPNDLLHQIKMLTGVVEIGLFCHMAKSAYFGNEDGSVSIKWADGRVERVDLEAINAERSCVPKGLP